MTTCYRHHSPLHLDHHHHHRCTSTSTTMATFSYPPITTLDCPVVRRNNSHHVHLDNQRFDSSGIILSPYSIPKVGRLCNFSSSHPRGDRNSFLGRILRTIQWQRSRTIVRVEHDNGLASFALALPHHRVYQGWTLKIIQFIARWLPEDSEELAEGEFCPRHGLDSPYPTIQESPSTLIAASGSWMTNISRSSTRKSCPPSRSSSRTPQSPPQRPSPQWTCCQRQSPRPVCRRMHNLRLVCC